MAGKRASGGVLAQGIFSDRRAGKAVSISIPCSPSADAAADDGPSPSAGVAAASAPPPSTDAAAPSAPLPSVDTADDDAPPPSADAAVASAPPLSAHAASPSAPPPSADATAADALPPSADATVAEAHRLSRACPTYHRGRVDTGVECVSSRILAVCPMMPIEPETSPGVSTWISGI